jgi:hypothetical protein
MSTQLSNQFTKEAIKARMIQNAANIWGVKNPQSLDPFVRLLIEAFSIEIYRASNEVQNIEGRMLDKIASLLTPNLITMPQPAHGIMQAMPAEAVQKLNSLVHLFTTKRVASRTDGLLDVNVDINFTPVDTVHLTRAKIAYLAAGHQLFSFSQESGHKVPLLRTASALPWATCYIGIEVDNEVDNLADTALYFDFASFSTQPWVYQLLPLASFTLGGHVVETMPGLQYVSRFAEVSREEQIFRDHDMMRQLASSVKVIYDHKFLTLQDCPVKSEGSATGTSFPEDLLQSFDAAALSSKAGKNVAWIQVKFPANYTYPILEELFISTNAFPVLNRALITNTYSYKSLNNILPLRTAAYEHFLSVHHIADGHNRVFTEIPFNRAAHQGNGYYSLRHGGAERFDERSAQDVVNYLLELTRDEVAAFSSINQDYLITSLKDLAKQLRLLQNRAGRIEANIREVPTYLVVEPYNEDDNLEVEYWISQGELANNLRAGTVFQLKGNSDLLPNSIMLLTDTIGGREKLQSGERLDAYRYVLESRGRLITNEDIRNFCKFEMTGKIKDVVFKKGLTPSHHPRQSYIRTLDIKLIPHRYEDFDDAGWAYMAQALQAKIIANSPDAIHYRVLIEKQA